MLNKEYVLRNLYQIVCLEIPSEDELKEWIESCRRREEVLFPKED